MKSFSLSPLSDEEFNEYIENNLPEDEREEYDSRREVKKMLDIFDKNLDKIRDESKELRRLMEEDVPKGYFVKESIATITNLLKRNINRVSDIGRYSGAIKGKDRIDIMREDAQFTQDGEHLHITYGKLLPKRIKQDSSFTYADIWQMYAPAFTEFFSTGKHIIYTKKAAIIYTHFFSSEKEFVDHDNFETKIITDLITSNLLLDDSPKYCSIFMDYKMGEKSHTEIDVVPFSQLKEYV